MTKTCKEYQDDIKINAQNDENAKKNQEALEVKQNLKLKQKEYNFQII